MSTPIFTEIEKYIRETIAKNTGSFNRAAILMQSKEWMEKYPVEFNSILNMIENEGRNDGCDEMDDSTPSVAFGSRFVDDSMSSMHLGGYCDDSTPSVAYHGGYADDSTPSVAYHGGYADDSTPSFAFGSRYGVVPTPPQPVAHHDEYSGNIMPDHMSSVSDSPMGSDHIDSSPGGYPDDDFESDMPLQRTMSSAPPRK
jgi:hypothetical protein